MKTSKEFLSFLHEWEGTPYATQMRECGRGVDCVNFVSAYADWLTGTLSDVVALPKLLGYNDRKKTLSAIKTLERSWENSLVDFKGKKLVSVLRPGDAIATRCGSHPVHLVLVGPMRGTIWHASNEHPIPGIPNNNLGVRMTALNTAITMGIDRVWRFDAARNMDWLRTKSNACC
jgi:hypothetical protein